MLKAVIFDFDGTLADTLPIVFRSFQEIFRSYKNETKTAEDIKALFGPSEERIIRGVFDEKDYAQAVEDYHDYYWKHHDKWVKRSREIERLLQLIRERGLKLAIMTGKGRRSLDLSLKALGMEKMFDMTVTGDEVVRPKPDPEGLLKIVEAFDVSPNEAVFVGDSDTDVRAGKRAGMETIAVQWLSTPQTENFAESPDHLFTDPACFQVWLEQALASK
ncbi:MAG TPA: HAD family hydrolase [Bacillales bacterium]|nr:HAD family hydrolase [Bacillales bacterium]